MDDNTVISFNFPVKNVNLILEALAEQPFKKSADVINNIHQQVQVFLQQEQNKGKAAEAAPVAEEKPVEEQVA